MVHVVPDAVVLPSTVVPSSKVIVAPASQVPLNVGVVMLVWLSVFDVPSSLAAIKSGAETFGPVVSMVTTKAPEGVLELPARFVARAVMGAHHWSLASQ